MSDRRPPVTIAELLRRSDFARADPRRASELLDRVADPLFEDRNTPARRSEKAA